MVAGAQVGVEAAGADAAAAAVGTVAEATSGVAASASDSATSRVPSSRADTNKRTAQQARCAAPTAPRTTSKCALAAASAATRCARTSDCAVRRATLAARCAPGDKVYGRRDTISTVEPTRRYVGEGSQGLGVARRAVPGMRRRSPRSACRLRWSAGPSTAWRWTRANQRRAMATSSTHLVHETRTRAAKTNARRSNATPSAMWPPRTKSTAAARMRCST